MKLFVVGASYATTPLGVLEKLVIGQEQLQGALSSLLEGTPQAVLLSTCNRTEVYAVEDGDISVRDAIADFMSDLAGVPEAVLRPCLYVYEGRQAVEHLFRVAAGLDSMVIGEAEILGQVRRALQMAQETGNVGQTLLNLFRHAVRTGRRVRHETRLGMNASSVSSIAVDLATKTIGGLSNRRVLVVGAGDAGRLVVKAARARGAGRITITNRSQERARALADTLGSHYVPMSRLQDELRGSDVVVTCAGGTDIVLDQGTVETAMGDRLERPLVILDIAVPHNVEPDVRQIENVSLFDIDGLTQIARANEQLRRREIPEATNIVDAEVESYIAWFQALAMKPMIQALVRKGEAIRQAQLDILLKKLRPLSDEERESVESMTRAIMKKMLHDPLQSLKRNGNDVHTEVVAELFGLGSEASE